MDGALKSRFIISLPFTMKFTKTQVLSQLNSIDVLDNTIVSGHDILRGVTKERVWNSDGHKLYTHIYYREFFNFFY
ncbi:hypothetical protein FACS1894204_12220 [Synergistales bacterium]|nr:hypothetical protein FACS1894204_12220 [Synergistales bacterium]